MYFISEKFNIKHKIERTTYIIELILLYSNNAINVIRHILVTRLINIFISISKSIIYMFEIKLSNL
jgi:hypothetical protein